MESEQHDSRGGNHHQSDASRIRNEYKRAGHAHRTEIQTDLTRKSKLQEFRANPRDRREPPKAGGRKKVISGFWQRGGSHRTQAEKGGARAHRTRNEHHPAEGRENEHFECSQFGN